MVDLALGERPYGPSVADVVCSGIHRHLHRRHVSRTALALQPWVRIVDGQLCSTDDTASLVLNATDLAVVLNLHRPSSPAAPASLACNHLRVNTRYVPAQPSAVLVLVIGDLHIPIRSHDLPSKFKKLLVPGKIQQVLLTGNVCDGETLEWLRSISNGDVRMVRGDYDEIPTAPPSQVITHGPLRIGIIHGHQVVPLGDTEALSAVARKLDVDVLISGATHKFEAFEFEGRFFLNPGSATGAFTFAKLAQGAQKKEDKKDADAEGATDDTSASLAKDADKLATPNGSAGTTPSFALMDLQGNNVVTYVYQLVDGEVRVERVEFRKD